MLDTGNTETGKKKKKNVPFPQAGHRVIKGYERKCWVL